MKLISSIFAFVLLLSLAPLSMAAANRASPFAGSWQGTGSIPGLGATGTVTLKITSAGKVTGTASANIPGYGRLSAKGSGAIDAYGNGSGSGRVRGRVGFALGTAAVSGNTMTAHFVVVLPDGTEIPGTAQLTKRR